MDRRKGLTAGIKKLGPTGRFIFWITVIGFMASLIFGIKSCVSGATQKGQQEIIGKLNQGGKKSRPDLSILLTNNNLEIYPKSGTFALSYRLKNSGDLTAYNIRKGHLVFPLSEVTLGNCKKFYEPESKRDVLKAGEISAAHKDDIGILNHNQSYTIQLVITYSSSKSISDKKFYSLANFEIQPDDRHEKLFKVLQKSLDSDEGAIDEVKIIDSINICREIKS